MGVELNPEDLARRMGFRETPEALVASALPIERGHNVALLAGRGAGRSAVYALAAAHVCEPGAGMQSVVLVPSRERALQVALSMQSALAPLGVRVMAPPLRPDGSLDASDPGAQCLVERPSLLLPEVRLGRLGLADLRLLVIDGFADLEDLDEWSSAEPLLDTLPSEARRLVASRRVDEPLRELVRHHLPRARVWPDGLFADPGGDEPSEADADRPGPPPVVHVGQASSEAERLAILLEVLGGLPDLGPIDLRCRSEVSSLEVSAALASAGLEVTAGEEPWDLRAVRSVTAAAPEAERPTLVWYGLPLSAAEMLVGDPASYRVAIVDVVHRPQLELLAERVPLELRMLPGLTPAAELDPLGRYRGLVRARIERGGTDAELLVMEPLFREFGIPRVAAALSDLLRRSGAVDANVKPWADVEAASRGPQRKTVRGDRSTRPEHRGVRGAWSRIYVGAGKRDEVRASDLVGAITGETGIAGAQIGKIDIKGSFSLIEVDSQVVDEVIRKLDGVTIRGRAVNVRPDRSG